MSRAKGHTYRVLMRQPSAGVSFPMWAEVGELHPPGPLTAADFGNSWGSGEYLYWQESPEASASEIRRIVVVGITHYIEAPS